MHVRRQTTHRMSAWLLRISPKVILSSRVNQAYTRLAVVIDVLNVLLLPECPAGNLLIMGFMQWVFAPSLGLNHHSPHVQLLCVDLIASILVKLCNEDRQLIQEGGRVQECITLYRPYDAGHVHLVPTASVLQDIR